MIRIEYEARQVWKRIIVFQGIPLLSLMYGIGVANGGMVVRSATGLMIALVLGSIMYAFMMALLLKALRDPLLFGVDEENGLIWNAYFTRVSRQLPPGTKIEITQKQLRVTPMVHGLAATTTDGDATVFSLPQALKAVKPQTIVLRGKLSLADFAQEAKG